MKISLKHSFLWLKTVESYYLEIENFCTSNTLLYYYPCVLQGQKKQVGRKLSLQVYVSFACCCGIKSPITLHSVDLSTPTLHSFPERLVRLSLYECFWQVFNVTGSVRDYFSEFKSC